MRYLSLFVLLTITASPLCAGKLRSIRFGNSLSQEGSVINSVIVESWYHAENEKRLLAKTIINPQQCSEYVPPKDTTLVKIIRAGVPQVDDKMYQFNTVEPETTTDFFVLVMQRKNKKGTIFCVPYLLSQ